MPRKLAAGNWKMNGTSAALAEAEALKAALPTPQVDVLICPPATLLSRLAEIFSDSPLALGGQDCHASTHGAHTGDISAQMLADAGADYVILGHSERRTDHAENDQHVRAKAQAALAAGLTAIVCVGETKAEREAANTLAIIGGQLAGSLPDDITSERLVVAYEPVWAIGTGLVPTLEQISEVHDFIRESLVERYGETIGAAVSLLYGGSVKGSNAAEIFGVTNVDGALVGGASLTGEDFLPIVSHLETN